MDPRESRPADTRLRRQVMNVNELLACTVVDSSGNVVGQVHDVTFVLTRPSPPTYELRYLQFQSGSVGDRLGYTYPDLEGPWPIAPVLRWFVRRRSRAVPWSDVKEIRAGRIDLSVTADALPTSIELVQQR